MCPLEKDDVLLVGQKAINQGRTCPDSRAVQNITTEAWPTAVPVIAAVDLLTHADGSACTCSDGARQPRSLCGVLLALAATLNRTLVVASSLGAGASLSVRERAGQRVLGFVGSLHVVEYDTHLGPASDAFRSFDEGHMAVHQTTVRNN